ncbi:hypothetical protein HELRODRAFT_102569 [Helobdella robusta]|uniref:Dystrophin n=1 Tax=Helobdella robusta TaxID=6412 RepID=T1EDA4_HELRO|nr:hypothetical protein HELRODRAFT_102569 [Helobdella robusta]ESN95567.1 hypothetical protein HELRODRAFT_102569 [Helobdella robusta]
MQDSMSKRKGSFSQHILAASVSQPWERATTDNHVPYYINHSLQSTHWDHPDMTKFMESLGDYDEVRFSAYRTAMKLRSLQKALHLDLITLDILDSSFQSFPTLKLSKSLLATTTTTATTAAAATPTISSATTTPTATPTKPNKIQKKKQQQKPTTPTTPTTTNNFNDAATTPDDNHDDDDITKSLDRTTFNHLRCVRVLGVVEMAGCLRSCFEKLHSDLSATLAPKNQKDVNKNNDVIVNKRCAEVDMNIPLAMDLVLNWLLNVFDSARMGSIDVSSFKTGLVMLCGSSMEEKYRYNTQSSMLKLSRRQLAHLLHDVMMIPKQIGEAGAFGGTNSQPSVNSCFEMKQNQQQPQQQITEQQFLNWTRLEPQSIVWVAVLHRLTLSEGASHHVKCHVCKKFPIKGLRYRCLKCFSLDMCQNCFFSGKTAKSHKLNHPMQEYSSETTSHEDVKDFTKIIRNKFRSKRYFQRHRRLGYLPVDNIMFSSNVENTFQNNNNNNNNINDVIGNNNNNANDADVNASKRNTHTDQQNEHNLIAQYCLSLKGYSPDGQPSSPLEIMKKVDGERKEEIEEMIVKLELENRNLQTEYDRLLQNKSLLANKNLPSNDDSPKFHKTQVFGDASKEEVVNGGVAVGGGGVGCEDVEESARKLEEKLRALDESNQLLHAELSQILDQESNANRRILRFPSTSSSPTSKTPVVSSSAAVVVAPSSSPSSTSSLPRRDPPTFSQRDNAQREAELDDLLKRLQTSDLPLSPGEASVDGLFREVEEINRAVETLVDIMTEDEGDDNEATHHHHLSSLLPPPHPASASATTSSSAATAATTSTTSQQHHYHHQRRVDGKY